MKQLLVSVTLVVMLFTSAPAFAWGAKGHQIGALIAEASLKRQYAGQDQSHTSQKRNAGKSLYLA